MSLNLNMEFAPSRNPIGAYHARPAEFWVGLLEASQGGFCEVDVRLDNPAERGTAAFAKTEMAMNHRLIGPEGNDDGYLKVTGV